MLLTYLSSFVTFLWGLIATPVSIGLAKKFRLLDVPDKRKIHAGIMPRGAGLVLWSGYLLWALFAGNAGAEVPFVATGATFVFIVGYMDDMHPLPPLLRLFFHAAAACWIAYPLSLPVWQRAVIVLWITGATNAYNLIDGMDGLCLVMALITSLIAAYAWTPLVWLPIAGLVFGVLLWNFPSPRTFLGDGGSTLLGYVCASHLAWSAFPELFGKNVAILCLMLLLLGGVPVADTLMVMSRRILSGKSPFLPDRGHSHHKLLDAGFSKLSALFVLGSAHAALLSLGVCLLRMKIF